MAEPEINLGAPIAHATVVAPLASPVLPPQSNQLPAESMRALLQQGFPQGLIEELGNSKLSHPIRYWVVDNSGSMRNGDGTRMVGTRNRIQVVQCTRWKELQEAVQYHINLAGTIEASTTFRLLNDPGRAIAPAEFSVADPTGGDLSRQLAQALDAIEKCTPTGVTPLTQHVNEIYARVASLSDSLKREGQKAVVVLATDGMPSDNMGQSNQTVRNEFVGALRRLQTLPVWVVVRLCTDDDSVVDYYNELDRILEAPLEVLDDFFGEGKEISSVNPWLNYGLPLHRCREMGYHKRSFDLLDEKALSKDEMFEFVKLLFGAKAFAGAPDMFADWKGFSKHLEKVVKQHGTQWNPVTEKNEPWINMKKINKTFGDRRFGFFR